MSDDSTLKIKADISNLKAELQQASRLIRLANSEFKNATAGMDSWSTSADGLSAKVKQLGTVLDQEKAKLANLKQQHDLVAKSEGENSSAAQKLAIQINNQEASIKKTESQLEKYQGELEKVKSAGDGMGDLSALDKQQKNIEETEAELEKLKNKYASAKLAEDATEEETKELAKEIKDLSGKLKEDREAMDAAKKAADNLDSTLDDTAEEASEASDGFTTMKAALADLVASGIKKAIDGFVDLGKQAFEAGTNFESAMSKVAAISGATGSEVQQLHDKAKELGAATKYTATESADALSYMAMAGWKTQDMLDGLSGVMNLAAASGEDLGTTSDIVTDSLTAFGMTAKDTDKYVDLLASAATNTNTDVGKMGETFKYAAPVAGSLGYTAQDTATALGLMANGGIKASQAGTSLRGGLLSMAKPGKQAGTVMDEFGISLTNADGSMKSLQDVMVMLRQKLGKLDKAEQTAALSALVGKNAYSGWANVINASKKDFDKTTQAMANSSGAAQKMADTMNDNVAGAMTLLGSKVEGVFIDLFEKASPTIRKAIKEISTAIDNIDLDSLGKTVGNIATAVGTLFKFLLTNLDTIKNLIVNVGSVLAAMWAVGKMQTFFNTLKSGTTLFTALTGAIKSMIAAETAAATATEALSVAQAALPLVAIAAAIGTVLYGAIKKHNEKVQEAIEKNHGLTKAQKENLDALKEDTEAYKSWKKAADDANTSTVAEYNQIETLKNSYNSLIDKNGQVVKGKENQAKIIKTQLAEAMGVEVSKINSLIEKNGKLGESIDQLIQKKKAQAILDASKDSYTTALQNRQKAVVNYQKAQDGLTKAEEHYGLFMKVNKDVINQYNNLYDKNAKIKSLNTIEFLNQNKDIIAAYKAEKNAVDDSRKALGKSSTQMTSYTSTIKNYEDLAAAVTSGNSKKIKNALENQVNSFVSAKNGTKKALTTQLKNYKENYKALKKALKSGMGGVTKSQVKEAKNMVKKAQKELNKFGPSAKKSMTNAGTQMSKGLKSTNSKNKKAASNLTKEQLKTVKKAVSQFKKIGVNVGLALSKGASTTTSKNKKAGTSVAKNAATGAGSQTKRFKNAGSSSANAFGNAINSSSAKKKAKSAGASLAGAAASGAKSNSKGTKGAGSSVGSNIAGSVANKTNKSTAKSAGGAIVTAAISGTNTKAKMSSLFKAGAKAGAQYLAGFNSKASKAGKKSKTKSAKTSATKKVGSSGSSLTAMSAGSAMVGSLSAGANSNLGAMSLSGSQAGTVLIISAQKAASKAVKKVSANNSIAQGISKGIMKTVASEQKALQNAGKNALNGIKKTLLNSIKSWNVQNAVDSVTTRFSNTLSNQLSYATDKIAYANQNVINKLQSTVDKNTKSKAKAAADAAKPYNKKLKDLKKELAAKQADWDKKVEKAKTKKEKDKAKKDRKDALDKIKASITAQTDARKKAVDKSNKDWDKTINANKAKLSNYTAASEKMLSELQTAMQNFETKANEYFSNTITSITDEYNAKYDDLIQKQDDLISKMQSFGDLFEISSANVITLNDIAEQTKQITDYANKLAQIKGKVSADLFEQITSYDVDQGTAYVDQLLKMSTKELAAYNTAYSKKLSVSKSLGTSIYKSDIESVKTSYEKAIETALKNMPAKLESIGKDCMKGFVNGFTKNTNYMSKAVKQYTSGIITQFKKNFKIKSPSRVMIDIGGYVGDGLAIGLTDTVKDAQRAAGRLSSAVVSPFNNLSLSAGAVNAAAAAGAGQVVNNYNLVQNNTSPKSLSALETYQARRKQIAMLKAVR